MEYQGLARPESLSNWHWKKFKHILPELAANICNYLLCPQVLCIIRIYSAKITLVLQLICATKAKNYGLLWTKVFCSSLKKRPGYQLKNGRAPLCAPVAFLSEITRNPANIHQSSKIVSNAIRKVKCCNHSGRRNHEIILSIDHKSHLNMGDNLGSRGCIVCVCVCVCRLELVPRLCRELVLIRKTQTSRG